MKALKVTDLLVSPVNDVFDEPDDDDLAAEAQGRDAARSAFEEARAVG